MTTIAENIGQLSAQLRDFEQLYERPAGSVNLLAVSKRHSVDSIIEANEAGIQDFGENYLQEAVEKIEQLASIRANWHFIGPIQANKTRLIAQYFQWVHSVDRLKIAQRLSDQRDPSNGTLNICIQVNLSNEASKSGIPLNEVEALCTSVDTLPGLKLRGLMAIPAALSDLEAQRQTFRALSDEFTRLQPHFDQFDTLSMGMSNDFEAAVAEGSTLIRIGTAIFGARD